jgi:acetyl esterase/lipase
VFLLDYRRSPENPLPAPADDAFACYNWLLKNQQIAPANLVIAGDSAGAHLTMLTLLRIRTAGLPLPAAAMLISPWSDLTGSTKSLQSNIGRDVFLVPHKGDVTFAAMSAQATGTAPEDPESRRKPEFSPVFAPLHSLPPIMVMVGEYDRLCDDGLQLARKLQEAGNRVELVVGAKMQHDYPLFFALAPEADNALTQLAQFAQKALGTD